MAADVAHPIESESAHRKLRLYGLRLVIFLLFAAAIGAVLIAWRVDHIRLSKALSKSEGETHRVIRTLRDLEGLEPLKTGNSGQVGYRLFARFNGDLILFLQCQDKATISPKSVSLLDSRGREVEFHKLVSPQTMGPGEESVAHLLVLGADNLVDDSDQPWTIRFEYHPNPQRANDDGALVIDNIRTYMLPSLSEWFKRHRALGID